MLDENGNEVLDPKPVSVPIGWQRPPTLTEHIQRLVRNHVSRMAAAEGRETFDEADDFEIPDDPMDPTTPYEENFDPGGVLAREQEIRSGFVDEMPAERKKKARETIEKARQERAPKSAAKSDDKPAPGSTGAGKAQ